MKQMLPDMNHAALSTVIRM